MIKQNGVRQLKMREIIQEIFKTDNLEVVNLKTEYFENIKRKGKI